MNFTPITVAASGSLIGYVDGLTTAQIMGKFEHFNDALGDENYITFVSDDGTKLNLYDRHGNWRIGGLVEDDATINAFLAFLASTFGTVIKYTPVA
jgi:hypothetical protein